MRHLTPVSLAGPDPAASWPLMSLYESNYIRLVRLVGTPGALIGTYRSRVAGDCDLLLAVVERCAYTSILDLTYELLDGREPVRFRSCACACITMRGWSRPSASPAPAAEAALQSGRCAERELHQRWMRNMMLNKCWSIVRSVVIASRHPSCDSRRRIPHRR